MKAIHVISDSDAPVMLGAGLYLVKAYLTAWKIVMEQKGRVGCSCRAAHMAIPEDAWPFPDKAGSVRAVKSFLFKEISMQKKLLVFLVLLLILPVACMARDFDGFRAPMCAPGWGGSPRSERVAMVVRNARTGTYSDW